MTAGDIYRKTLQAASENPELCVTLPRQNAHLPDVNSAFVSVASLDFGVFGGRLHFIAGLLPGILLALSLSLFSAGCTGKQASGLNITILHTNDAHSAYGGFTENGRLCHEPVCEGGKGGSVRMQQAVRAIRRESPGAILLNAGDVFQGSLYWAAFKEAMPVSVLGMMEYQATIPGNHEFDDGCKPLLNQARSLNPPMLAANLSFDPPLEGADSLAPWLTLERGGRKIGIVGIANPDTPSLSSPCAEAHFAGAAETLRAAIKELRAQGVNIIIALTHIGLENDKRLARAVDGVNIIVGGHSHSLLSNNLPGAEGPYPVVERSPEGKPVIIVTASTAMQYLGRLDVRFDKTGVPVSWQGEPITLDDYTLAALNAPAPDTELVRVMENYSEPVRQMMNSPIGTIMAAGREGKPLEDPNVLQCRQAECLTGNIVADALLTQAFSDARAAIINSGALRNSLPGGTVTTGDVMATLPFQNTPVRADIPGAVLLEALEHGVSAYGEGQGSFLQVSGLRYVFDPGKAPGERIVKAEIYDEKGGWQHVRRDDSYGIVTVDFLSGGGDGYAMLSSLQWQESTMLMNDALRLHLEKNSPLTVKLEGRIRLEHHIPANELVTTGFSIGVCTFPAPRRGA
jgi:5'-nucleotidase